MMVKEHYAARYIDVMNFVYRPGCGIINQRIAVIDAHEPVIA
jgi:hypothetical protein